jgi:uncharacterized coiled-coil DUF342 family protein
MDQEVKDMFTQVLAAIHLQGTKIDMLITEVALIKEDITEMKTEIAVIKRDITEMKTEIAVIKRDITEMQKEIAGLHTKFDFLSGKVQEHDIAIWQMKHQVG